MNNLVNINQSDPIFEEFEAFVDKNAGIKTIAFKYFGAASRIRGNGIPRVVAATKLHI